MVTKKKQVEFSIALILFPVILLSILEISLRLFDYGNKSKLFFNPKFVPEIYHENVEGYNKYVDKNLVVTTDKIENFIRNVMQTEKKTGTLRGFVVGGSAAQGFPYNSNHSFSKMIEGAVIKTGKYTEVEVLNMGISAISTYPVRDISKKVLGYNPDFLVVYAGNNEYYGTFSHITGGNHFTRTLYMKLYELKMFQMMKDFVALFGPKEPKKQDRENIMKERFHETYMPKNEKTDQLVAQNYVKNIEAIVKMFNKKNVPVIIVEPVCNLIGMPPFKGEKDDEIAKNLKKIDWLINTGNVSLAGSALGSLKNTHGDNANVNYLDAKLYRAENNKIDLEKYITAKNNDIIPFRPREELIDNLEKFCEENTGKYENLSFIPLRQVIRTMHGDSILGNTIFIDHVHFNQHGHKIIGEIISGKLADVLQFKPNETDSVKAFFSDEEKVFQSVYSLPVYRFSANGTIKKLTTQPPFNEMVFPYKINPKEANKAINDMGAELALEISPMDINNAYNFTIRYYIEKQEFQLAHEYFLADRFLFPGSYGQYLSMGKFFRMFDNLYEGAERAYIHAYLLSEKKPEIYKEIINFFNEANRPDKIKEFHEKYRNPGN